MIKLWRRFADWWAGEDGWFLGDDPYPTCDQLSHLDRLDGLDQGNEEHDRFWADFVESEREELRRDIAGDYPA